MTFEFTIFDIISTIGIVALAGMLVYIGRKLQILDDLQETFKEMEGNIKLIADRLIKE